MMELAAKG